MDLAAEVGRIIVTEDVQLSERLQLIHLLRAVSQDCKNLPLATFDEEQIHWAVETGLGPLLFCAVQGDPQAPLSSLWPMVHGANLTAQVLASEHVDAMGEILDACERRVERITLLKGISICEQYYPQCHLRLMRDIDFLVSEADLPATESVLRKLGYHQESTTPPESYQNHHHSAPFYHPQRGVWVEVHRALFPRKGRCGQDYVLSLKNLTTQFRPSIFQGRAVYRLSDELQIVYIASHWACNFNVVGGLVSLVDMIYLLKNARGTVCWEQILEWLRGSIASTYLYLMLSYLRRHHLIELASEILDELFSIQKSLGTIGVIALHGLIDRYFVDGTSFGRVASLRNLDIVWKGLLSTGPPCRNVALILWNLFLPWRFRRS